MKTGKITKRQHAPAPQDPSETTPRGEQHNKNIARGENQKEDEEVAAKIEDKEAVRANVDEASITDIPGGPDAKVQKRKKEPKRKTRQYKKDTAKKGREREQKGVRGDSKRERRRGATEAGRVR